MFVVEFGDASTREVAEAIAHTTRHVAPSLVILFFATKAKAVGFSAHVVGDETAETDDTVVNIVVVGDETAGVDIVAIFDEGEHGKAKRRGRFQLAA